MTIYKTILICILSLSLCGCMKYVYVPVWTCPAPTIPQKEALQTKTLDKTADTDTILKAYIYDISYLNGLSEQLYAILRGYSQQKETMQIFTDRVLQSK